jgi:hypothetical protein
MLRIDYILFSDEFEPLSYEVVDSWGLEQTIKGRGENADTLLVRAYGNGMPLPDEQQLREAMILPPTAEKIKMDNRIIYSDHYPVFVRLLYNGKNH